MFKAKNWRKIADFIYINGHNLPRRTADQCNQRWLRTIDPKITKGNWPAEEDMQLIAAVKVCPSRNWKAISALMPNRTDVQIRGRLQRLAPMLLERGILTADQLPPFLPTGAFLLFGACKLILASISTNIKTLL